ncbi:hypothetical protein ENSA5_49040 [Enhygromyxa salina]|uniref:Glyoxalase-related protein domain-containing protein n=1 Tax=Enhygromyxa salina TaxID=215803 RepID=A0A2S9XID3_9BACT|nr:hypothetical protein ENSA5_49040 [Enhygromyxa salina]
MNTRKKLSTSSGLKAQAKRLRTHLAEQEGITLSHSQTLEAVAGSHGYKDWNTAAALENQRVHRASTEKVYLAGKISPNGWRHGVVDSLRGVVSGSCWTGDPPDVSTVKGHGHTKNGEWPVLHGVVLGRHDYVGPYFVSCDHRCFHGPSTHGTSMAWDPSETYQRCIGAIEKSTVVFAWIESIDAYGTLYELGYARSLGKRIVVASPPSLDTSDLWFSCVGADLVLEGALEECLQKALARKPLANRCSTGRLGDDRS